MELVATLISDPGRKDLTERQVATVLDTLQATGWAATPAAWLDKDIACDIFFQAPTLDEARALVRNEFSNAGFDVIVQPSEHRRKTLLLADMDSTIVVGETLDELAGKAGIKDRVAEITAARHAGRNRFQGGPVRAGRYAEGSADRPAG